MFGVSYCRYSFLLDPLGIRSVMLSLCLEESTGFMRLSLQGLVGIPYDAGHLLLVFVISGFRQVDDRVVISRFSKLDNIFNCYLRFVTSVSGYCPEIAPFIIHNSLAHHKRVGLGQPTSRWRSPSVRQTTLR